MQSPQPGDILREPRPQDVAASRHRSWNRHAQNIFYRGLVSKAATVLKGENDKMKIPKAADRIIDIIMIDKGGVFVKETGVEDEWIVMQPKDIQTKVQQAIRNHQIKIKNGGKWKRKDGEPVKRKKKKRVGAFKTSVSDTTTEPTSKKPHAHPIPKEVSYQAQAGEQASIHPYALRLISAVCNAPNPRTALNVLNNPFLECFVGKGEPPMERSMRLQLRQRYAGALATNISPLGFSKELLAFWGGKLVEREMPTPQPQQDDVPAATEIEPRHAPTVEASVEPESIVPEEGDVSDEESS